MAACGDDVEDDVFDADGGECVLEGVVLSELVFFSDGGVGHELVCHVFFDFLYCACHGVS